MSIIYDALQKTQKNRENKQSHSIGMSPKRSQWLDVILGVVIVSLLVFVVVGYYPRWSAKKAVVIQPKSVVAAIQPVVKRSVEIPYKGNLVLNGVFISDQEKLALINNQSLHVGDTVEGMKIVSVSQSSVKLRKEGQVFVLRTV